MIRSGLNSLFANEIAPFLNLQSNINTGRIFRGGQVRYLVEVEKVTMLQMEDWRKQYPEVFEREYDPASGLRFNGWVEGSM